MSLKDLLKPTKGGNARTVASIEQKITQAQELVITCQKEANTSALEAEDGGDAVIKRAKQAREALMDAQNRLGSLSGALMEARARQTLREHADADSARAKSWKETERLAKRRHDLGVEIQVLIENLIAKYGELTLAGIEMHKTAPDPGNKLHNSMLAPSHIESSFRLHMVKMGLSWANSWPWGADTIVTLSERVTLGNDAILSRRDKAEAA